MRTQAHSVPPKSRIAETGGNSCGKILVVPAVSERARWTEDMVTKFSKDDYSVKNPCALAFMSAKI